MKPRHALIIALLLASVLSAAAQTGLATGSLFDGRFRDMPNARETIISGGKLSKYKLSTYRSIAVSDADEATVLSVEAIVKQDGAKAQSREVQYRDGHLFYGFYTLRPASGNNRYIFYLNQPTSEGNKLIVIYLEGKATPDKVKQMLKQ